MSRLTAILALMPFAVSAAFAFTLAAAPAAHAMGCFDPENGTICEPDPNYVPERYAALAVSDSTRASGSAWGQPSRAAAERVAMSYCLRSAKDCHLAGWVLHRCLALAVSDDGGWASEAGVYLENAEAKALNTCRNDGGLNCHITIHPCSDD